MFMNLTSTLLEGIVLSNVKEKKDGTYGYEIYMKLKYSLVVSESGIYQALYELSNERYINTESFVMNGRIRKIYTINEKGLDRLYQIRKEWSIFSNCVSEALSQNSKQNYHSKNKSVKVLWA